MARKLFIMMALIGLALLVQAAPGLAVTYKVNLDTAGSTWQEIFNGPPGRGL